MKIVTIINDDDINNNNNDYKTVIKGNYDNDSHMVSDNPPTAPGK
jgi:hypothetical protein